MVDHLKILDEVIDEHKDHNKWEETRFEKIKRLSNTLVGSIGQKFTERLCASLEIPCEFPANLRGVRSTQSPWDVKISQIDFELKTATEDISGNFQFNHIRYHRTYDALLCLGISPDTVRYDMWTKAEVTTGQAGTLVSMERHANASYKLTKRAVQLKNFNQFYDDIIELAANLEVSRRRLN